MGGQTVPEGDSGFRCRAALKAGESLTLTSVSAVYTTLDCPNPLAAVEDALKTANFDALLRTHTDNWENICLWARWS